MPNTSLTASGTTQVKLGMGYLMALTVVKADGTTTSVRALDGPDGSGNFRTLLGSAAIVPAATAIGVNLVGAPIEFSNGLEIIFVAGTGGEVLVEWV
jgi:hypothetical protein